ncbi:mobilization protein [Martelella sp. HB161492]|uniref:mobilization protein n=1 Tax=Martelella sp. HB161492 TaxID=2720726 RepID=UPI0015914668|nr:mobilization protein [Martelella sp. HB161492]
MAQKSIEQRLAELEQQKKTLKARLGKQERSRDTRRKVLLGAFLLHRLEHKADQQFVGKIREWITAELPEFLTRDGDKELFDEILNPNSEAKPGSEI